MFPKFYSKFVENLPADPVLENQVRKVFASAYSFVNPVQPTAPKVMHVSKELAGFLGFDIDFIESSDFAEYMSGKKLFPNSKPYAMAYAGHQFGNWAGQLGDGRAITLGEVEAKDHKLYSLQLKGSGKTPYSRTADGLAVLRSSVREHLCSEAMHHLGIPTTRSLSLIATGDAVLRDMLYNGNPAYEPGAVVCRVAESFIRFGNFELFASRNEPDLLQQMVDFTVSNYFPEIKSKGKQKVIDFFKSVAEKTTTMIVDWQRVGFVHGVMNTDNMSILGLTIDYGPYGWMDNFDLTWTPNTTDKDFRRYRYENQPIIAMWNLVQLANALYSLVNEVLPFQEIIDSIDKQLETNLHTMWKSKLGLFSDAPNDTIIVASLLELLQNSEVDMILFFRNLANFKNEEKLDFQYQDLDFIANAFYKSEIVKTEKLEDWLQWLEMYQTRLQKESFTDAERKQKMDLINPKYVLRNYMAQLAIDAAEKEDYSLINELYTLLQKPYEEQPEMEKWFAKRPDWALDKPGCSMLSCSS